MQLSELGNTIRKKVEEDGKPTEDKNKDGIWVIGLYLAAYSAVVIGGRLRYEVDIITGGEGDGVYVTISDMGSGKAGAEFVMMESRSKIVIDEEGVIYVDARGKRWRFDGMGRLKMIEWSRNPGLAHTFSDAERWEIQREAGGVVACRENMGLDKSSKRSLVCDPQIEMPKEWIAGGLSEGWIREGIGYVWRIAGRARDEDWSNKVFLRSAE